MFLLADTGAALAEHHNPRAVLGVLLRLSWLFCWNVVTECCVVAAVLEECCAVCVCHSSTATGHQRLCHTSAWGQKRGLHVDHDSVNGDQWSVRIGAHKFHDIPLRRPFLTQNGVKINLMIKVSILRFTRLCPDHRWRKMIFWEMANFPLQFVNLFKKWKIALSATSHNTIFLTLKRHDQC